MQGDQEGAFLEETRSGGTGGSPPDSGQWSRSVSGGVRSISYSHRELWEPGGAPGKSSGQVGAGIPTME